MHINFDNLYERFVARPLSHSQLESWRYNKDEWYNSYILGKRTPPNALMLYGSRIGDAIGTPESPIPDLNPPGTKEFKLSARLGDIYIVGYADHMCPKTLVLNENKSTDKPHKWNQKTVDKHPQMTMYALMLFLTHDIAPEDVTMYLNDIRTEHFWVPKKGFEHIPEYLHNEHTAEVAVRLKRPIEWYPWETKRTGADLLKYTKYIEKTVEDMHSYALERHRKGGMMGVGITQ